jgi:DNA polymerase-3 subunit gamma/tau
MSYQVLARHYRPRLFKDLVGQEHLVQTLISALRQDRFPHSILLTGVRGVGKTTSARLIARALNCLERDPQTMEPCGTCQACQDILQDKHLDVLELDAASRTSVDDIRDILDASQYKPVSARFKVFIIDEVHMLTKHAFNALLKTLEEPPPHVVFVFATTELNRIPDTIISRCMRFDLQPLSLDHLQRLMREVVRQENKDIEDQALLLLALSAKGSARDGLSLLERALALALAPTAVTGTLVQDMLGMMNPDQLLDILENLLKGDAPLVLETMAQGRSRGVNGTSVLQEVGTFLYALLMLSQNRPLPPMALTSAQQERFKRFLELSTPATLMRLWSTLQKGLEGLSHALSPDESLDILLLKLSYVHQLPSPETLAAWALGHQSPAPLPMAANDPSPSPDTVPVPSTFQALIDLCGSLKEPFLKRGLEHDVTLKHYDPALCRLEVTLAAGADGSLLKQLRTTLQECTKRTWTVIAIPADDPPQASSPLETLAPVNDPALQDPGLQNILTHFPGATIRVK